MAINWYEENGRKMCLITANVRSKVDPTIRKQPKRRFDVINDKMTEEKAKREEKALQREAERQVVEAENVGLLWPTLLDLFEKDAEEQIKNRSWSQREICFRDSISTLRRFAEEWNELRAGEITPADVTKLLHKLENQELAGATCVRFLGDVRKVFDFSLKRELNGVVRNPANGISIKSRRRKRDEVLSHEDIQKLLIYGKKYEPQWYFIWSFAVYTGMRNGELFALKWTDLDLHSENPLIRVQRSYNKRSRIYKETKTGETREVPICRPLMEVLNDLKRWHLHEADRTKKEQNEFILPRPGTWQRGLQAEVLRAFCKEIGIQPICFHSLRACFTTELLRRGVPQIKVQQVGGWKDMKSMSHYVRLSGVDVKGVTDALDFSSPEMQINPKHRMMEVVGERYEPTDDVQKVIPLSSRRLQSI